MRHRDLSDLISGGEMACSQIIRALLGIRHRPEHRDFQDALVDAWVSWLRTEELAGSLGVRRLRLSGQRMCGGYLNEIRLMEALILYHDPNAGVIRDGPGRCYRHAIRVRVQEMAMNYFSRPEREPKDPLQLSEDEFCKTYHAHNKEGQPCYKTKTLPEET
jgi:hypothetical protein